MKVYIPEKSVGEYNIFDTPTGRIFKDIFINEEKERHVDLFACEKTLLFETETFYFREIRSYLAEEKITIGADNKKLASHLLYLV